MFDEYGDSSSQTANPIRFNSFLQFFREFREFYDYNS
jgi:hypothetical protein